MDRNVVLDILRQSRAHFAQQYGVSTMAIFGSVARNEATVDSDVDILVEFDRPVGLFALFALQDELESLLGRSVDVGTVASLKPRVRDQVMGEAVYVR